MHTYLYLLLVIVHLTYPEDTIQKWKKRAVLFDNEQFVVIDSDATIGKESTIGCGVHILGRSTIGENCYIGHYTIIKNCIIGDGAKIHSHSVIEDSIIDAHSEIGPFAHIGQQSHIQKNAIIGNFVEIKRSNIGEYSKAKHLTYLGDATLEEHVNVGAGTITCNYNGVTKNKTYIKNHAFIGTNNSLVAPIEIGKGAMTAAGSTITVHVPDDCLAIGRIHKQVNKEGYASKLRERYQQEKESQK